MQRPAVHTDWFTDKQSLFLLLGGAILAILLAVNFLAFDSPDRARIVRVEGGVAIERQGTILFPGVGMLLNAQDTIRTSEGAFVEIAYDDVYKDIVRIGANSRVVFESARIQKKTTLFMDRGEIKLKLDSLEKGSTFKIRTPVAIAGVRGTAFGVEFKGKELLITDYESRIFVKGLTRKFVEMDEELLLNDGWKVQVAPFEKPARVDRMSADEHAAWKAWLGEINALPKTLSAGNATLVSLTNIPHILVDKPAAFLTMVKVKASASPQALALLLYAVLALGVGKVVEKVWA
ncbi:MAG: FecR domain-containing protein [Candidatus Omnitrophica bacterium]|nr:FecR domain-containing protein [Candidatus Omnitrophota bacterium]